MSSPAFLRGVLEHERGLFCNVVGAVLEEGRGHRPDPKARSAEDIIGHLIGHNQDLIEQHGTIKDIGNHLHDYREVLKQLGREFPPNFILKDVLDKALEPEPERLGG